MTISKLEQPSEVALQWQGLRFSWPKSQFTIAPDDLTLPAGKSLFIQGESGCGKSTLISLLCGVLPIQVGSLTVLGQDMSKLSSSGRDAFRGENLGIVFQQFNLIPYLDMMTNVLLPTRMFAKRSARAIEHFGSAKEQAQTLLVSLGLGKTHWYQPINQLSVGQQQRVAVARALMGNPALIIADEPTSSLDENNKQEFLQLLLSITQKYGSTLVMVSHDTRLADSFDQTLSLPSRKAINALA